MYPTDQQSEAQSEIGDANTAAALAACIAKTRADSFEQRLGAVTPVERLEDPDTPQGMAYNWMVTLDDAQVDPCTDPSAEQRYALATLYYGTQEYGWSDDSDWLSGESECTWEGVKCDDDMKVKSLSLSKFWQ